MAMLPARRRSDAQVNPLECSFAKEMNNPLGVGRACWSDPALPSLAAGGLLFPGSSAPPSVAPGAGPPVVVSGVDVGISRALGATVAGSGVAAGVPPSWVSGAGVISGVEAGSFGSFVGIT